MKNKIRATIGSTLILYYLIMPLGLYSQQEDSLTINKIYGNALESYNAYNNLRYLCKNIGGRLAGSEESVKAVSFGKKVLDSLGMDSVYLQPVGCRTWERGTIETATISSEKLGDNYLNICSLGESVGTGKDGISGKVIEVESFDELKELGKEKIKGKIVFFNKEWNQSNYLTFNSYGENAGLRVHGASEAAKMEATAVIVRSLASEIDEFPHTGIMRYDTTVNKIPAASICTRDADILSKWLEKDKEIQCHIKMDCHDGKDVITHNVIGEIRGKEYPNEIIVVSGHLDSWTPGEGAHDDGAGCMQAIDVARIFKELKIKPKHTIRVVLYMDEERHQVGGKEYARIMQDKNEKHIAALESDGGGFVPHGFSMDTNDSIINAAQKWVPQLSPYGIKYIKKGWGGVDISPMKVSGVPLIGLNVDSQRYFLYHHSGNDTFEHVFRRELQLGSASMAALVYLIDKYGF